MLRTSSIRSSYNALKQIHRNSSAATPALPSEKSDDSGTSSSTEVVSVSNSQIKATVQKRKSTMVAAAFASLKKPDEKVPFINVDEKISKCLSPEDLLTLTQKTVVDKQQALKLLGRSSNGSPSTSFCDPVKPVLQDKKEDLSLIRGVTAEDEAAKLVTNLTLSQSVKALSALANQKKRSLPLLRSIAENITRSKDKLDVKKSADILYALASLNFPNEAVLEKVSTDLLESIPSCGKPAVISSISTSLGRLRFHNERLLDCIGEWVVNNQKLCRSQEFVSILITLATVNHIPSMESKFFDVIVSQLTADDLPTASTWLDVVWALVIFGKATSEHYRSVLSQQFIQRILSPCTEITGVAWKKKLLNINGAAKLDSDYKGPRLEENKDINIVPMVRNKDKQLLVNSVLDTLATLFPSPSYLKNNIDTGMGFLIDGECRLDGKMIPFPLVDKRTGQEIVHKAGKSQKVAVMCWDYHDNTRGKIGLTGANALTVELLRKTGYRVLSVHYSEYNVKDKLSERVTFLEEKLKRIVSPNI